MRNNAIDKLRTTNHYFITSVWLHITDPKLRYEFQMMFKELANK